MTADHDPATVELVARAWRGMRTDRVAVDEFALERARAVVDALTAAGWRPPETAGRCGVRYTDPDDGGRWICLRDVPCDLHGPATPPEGGEQT